MDGVRPLEIAICDNNIHTVSVLEACRQYQEYLNGKTAKIGEVRLPGKIRE